MKKFEISVIIPTFNESASILEVIKEIQITLLDYDYEIIVVDDNSPDNTHAIVKQIAKNQKNILCVNRTWKKGLSSAVVEGASLSTKEYICVMDGDGQHDPLDIRKMIALAQNKKTDLIIGSRFLNTQESNSLSHKRNLISKTGITLTNFFIKWKSTDPLSGLFLMKHVKFAEIQNRLYKDGFKILFDILMLSKQLQVTEVQINFRKRLNGESKLNLSTIFNLGGQIIENLTKGIIPANFLVFSLVGTCGLIIHLIVLNIALNLCYSFITSNIFATIIAMSSNYLLNNYLTFHNIHRLFYERVMGLLKYFFANSLSIIANIGVASQFYISNYSVISSALFGITAGLILNYFLSANLVFKK